MSATQKTSIVTALMSPATTTEIEHHPFHSYQSHLYSEVMRSYSTFFTYRENYMFSFQGAFFILGYFLLMT